MTSNSSCGYYARKVINGDDGAITISFVYINELIGELKRAVESVLIIRL